MEILSDNAVMLQVKAGDLDRMGLLFERYHRQLYAFLFHMTRQKETSEDMVQNAFLRMLKYRLTFTGNGEFKTWMFHVARNVLYDHFHKNKNENAHLDVDEMEERIPGGGLPDERIEKQQELKMLAKALQSLDAEKRELLILYRFKQLKHREIAHLLGITEGAVKVRVHRALDELKNNYLQIAQ